MAFPVSKAELRNMDDEKKVPRCLTISVIVHRIANEVFRLASEGNSRYSCDVKTEDVIPMTERLLTMFPDCVIAIEGNVMNGWSNINISWL